MGGEELVYMGNIGRAHGIQGEITLKLAPDWREIPKTISLIWVGDSSSIEEVIKVSRFRIHSGKLILKLESIEYRDQAETLKGKFCYINKKERPSIQGFFYDDELTGMSVSEKSGNVVGKVKEILHVPAQDIIVVQDKQKEILIPFVDQFIVQVDKSNNRIIIDPIEGLLD